MTPTTGCLILAVVCVGLLAVAWRERARHQRTVNNWMDNAAFLRDEREEARAAASDRLDRLLKEERKVRDLQSQLDTTTHHNGDLQTKIAGLEKKLLKPDNDEQSVSDLAKLVYQGWHRCNEAASGRFRGHYSKPFVAADGEYELIYRRRGSPELADWKFKPPEVQEAEHDRIGALPDLSRHAIEAAERCCGRIAFSCRELED